MTEMEMINEKLISEMQELIAMQKEYIKHLEESIGVPA